MATCADCVHVEVCRFKDYPAPLSDSYIRESECIEKRCGNFKDRTRFVELPCEAYITIHGEVEQIHLFGCYGRYGINETSRIIRVEPFCFGKILFFTREEAEQALKEREENA